MNYRFEIKPRPTRYTVERIDARGRSYRTQCELAGGFDVVADSPEEAWRIACTDSRIRPYVESFNLTLDDFEVRALQ